MRPRILESPLDLRHTGGLPNPTFSDYFRRNGGVTLVGAVVN
jgi:hypothetical protein